MVRQMMLGFALVAAGCVTAPERAADPFHASETRKHTGIPSVAVSPENGRLWCTWYASPTPGEDSNNYCVLATSEDDGQTWRECLYADPDGEGPERTFDPEIWIAPDGKLRWFWTQRTCQVLAKDAGKNAYSGHAGAESDRLMMAVLDAEDEPDEMPAAKEIAKGVMMCKPTVRANGEILLPVAHWNRQPVSAAVVATTDLESFAELGGPAMREYKLFDEHQIVEKANGDLLMLIRGHAWAGTGIWSAESHDGGRTWTDAALNHKIKHPSSRSFITKLRSGHWLLVKHGPMDKVTGREQLMAFVSKDDGATWSAGFMLDERKGVSYPDGCEAPDGRIRVVYDRNRMTDQEILMATFTEEDVLAGKDVSGKVKLGEIIYRAPERKQ